MLKKRPTDRLAKLSSSCELSTDHRPRDGLISQNNLICSGPLPTALKNERAFLRAKTDDADMLINEEAGLPCDRALFAVLRSAIRSQKRFAMLHQRVLPAKSPANGAITGLTNNHNDV
jgi:hypothetical protein